MAKQDSDRPYLRAIVLFLIPTIASLFFYIKALSDKQQEVVITHSSQQAGYARVPAVYDVTASPHYRASHEVPGTWMVLSIVIFLIGAAASLLNLEQGVALGIWGACVVGGACLGVGRYSFHYYATDKYEKAIDSTTYQLNKADLDQIFEK